MGGEGHGDVVPSGVLVVDDGSAVNEPNDEVLHPAEEAEGGVGLEVTLAWGQIRQLAQGWGGGGSQGT